MPARLSEEAKRKKAAYDMQYQEKNIVRKFIPFNKATEEEAKMLDWLDQKGKGNVAGYIKGLIREDMQRSGK